MTIVNLDGEEEEINAQLGAKPDGRPNVKHFSKLGLSRSVEHTLKISTGRADSSNSSCLEIDALMYDLPRSSPVTVCPS